MEAIEKDKIPGLQFFAILKKLLIRFCVLEALHFYGFDRTFISWSKACFWNASSAVLYNGYILDVLSLKGGGGPSRVFSVSLTICLSA